MVKDDLLVEKFFQPQRSMSDQQILMNSNREGPEGAGKKSSQDSPIPGIYQEVKSSFEFMLHKITSKGGSQINIGGLDMKRQKRYQSSSLMKSPLMSLEQIMDTNTMKGHEPS